jgi:alpha-1,6-mannosyltransferase
MEGTTLFRLFPFLTMTVLLCLAPYTKVEESFNMQATHDLVFGGFGFGSPGPLDSTPPSAGRKNLPNSGGVSRSAMASLIGGGVNSTERRGSFHIPASVDDFDHQSFPGVVPRTFAGPIVISILSQPLLIAYQSLFSFEGETAFYAQFITRWVLGILVCLAFDFLGTGIQRETKSKMVAPIFSLLIGSQFHLMFYASRTLPNTYATALTALAVGLMYRDRYYHAFAVLGCAAAVFRSDVLVLVAPLALLLISAGYVHFFRGVLAGVVGIAVSLLLTVPLDSFFWGRMLWPEAAVLWFNTAMNKSSDWGVSPPLWYFYAVLPKILFTFIPVLPLALAEAGWKTRFYVMGALLFIALYSFLPHKELRFIMMGFPIFFIPVASYFANRSSTLLSKLVFGCFVAGNLAFAMFLVTLSMFNYPGAAAIHRVHSIHDDPPPPSVTSFSSDFLFDEDEYVARPKEDPREREHPIVKVYIDAYAGMTGVTRFLKKRPSKQATWVYNKDPALFNSTAGVYTAPWELGELSDFDYIIVRYEDKQWHTKKGYYEWVEDVETFVRLDLKRLQIVREPFLSIFRRLANVDWSVAKYRKLAERDKNSGDTTTQKECASKAKNKNKKDSEKRGAGSTTAQTTAETQKETKEGDRSKTVSDRAHQEPPPSSKRSAEKSTATEYPNMVDIPDDPLARVRGPRSRRDFSRKRNGKFTLKDKTATGSGVSMENGKSSKE